MQTAATERQRQATPDRWQEALRRAHANGVEARQVAGSGRWVATSGSRSGVCYATDGVTCECAAALAGDPVCQHRAAYFAALGVLVLFHEAAPALVVLPLVACDACDGHGWEWAGPGLQTAQYQVTCGVCDGAGRVEAPDEDYAPTAADLAAHEAPYGRGSAPRGACGHCQGQGSDPACDGHATASGAVICECPTCDGSGRGPSEEASAPHAA